jgi:hypothetical protein
LSKRTAKFVSALFASLLAGTPLATVSHGATEAADSCLSRPKGTPPAGGHWYYRVDRASKRNCWYIGDAKEKVSRAAPEASQPATNSVSPPSSASTQRSIANARAELPPPQARIEQEAGGFTGQQAPATISENGQRLNAGEVDAQRPVFASRWPELATVSSSAGAAPSTGNPQAIAQSNTEAAPRRPAAAVTLAAADASSARPSGSIQQVLIAIVAALALAGLLASAIFRFGGARRTGLRVDRRAIWDSVRADRPSPSDEARAAGSMRELGLPYEPRPADDPNERIAQMLSRLARPATT